MIIENLLDSDATSTFGAIDPLAKPRKTVVAAVFDPASNKFLCQYWGDYDGLTCLLSGGLEEGEDELVAVKREIAEETGYTDFKIAGILGGSIKSYYTKSDGESLVKDIVPYLVILNSHQQIPTCKEDDEKFDNLFKDPQEIIEMMEHYEHQTASPLTDHKEILNRAVAFLRKKRTS